jgi:CheY-like chemotaxis protein
VSSALIGRIQRFSLTPNRFDIAARRVHDTCGVGKVASMHIEISEGIRSVLIAEDEGMVALLMEDLVRELGVGDIHICSTVAAAREIAKVADIDCAVLDLRLSDGSGLEIADILAERGIPFVFSTGSARDVVEDRHGDRPWLAKPFTDDAFKTLLLDAWMVGNATAHASEATA